MNIGDDDIVDSMRYGEAFGHVKFTDKPGIIGLCPHCDTGMETQDSVLYRVHCPNCGYADTDENYGRYMADLSKGKGKNTFSEDSEI